MYSLDFCLNAVSFHSLLHQTQLLYLTKAAKVQKLLMSVISLNCLPPSEAVALNLTPLPFPERLITRRENLLCARFITVPKSCPGFFYFTGRALLEKSDCYSWFPPLIQSASNPGRDLRSPEEIGDSYQSSLPNKTQRRWGTFFLGCSMRAGRIRGRLCALVASSSCETGARFMVTLQRFFQPTSLVFISLVDKSGREVQLCILWSHQRATSGAFSRSVMPVIIAVSSLPFNLICEVFI